MVLATAAYREAGFRVLIAGAVSVPTSCSTARNFVQITRDQLGQSPRIPAGMVAGVGIQGDSQLVEVTFTSVELACTEFQAGK